MVASTPERGRPTPLAAVATLATTHRLRYDELVVLKDGSNLLVHLAPAPVVLRVATFTARIRLDPLPWLEREARLVTWLASIGAAVMAPSNIIPVGPHVVDGWAMSAWRYVEHHPGEVPDDRSTLAALDELHDAMRDYPGELPLLNPAADDLDRAIAFGVGQGLFSSDQSADLRGRRDELFAEVVAATPDRQALHGDAFTRNSLVADNGIVWIDFEDCCSGPTIWDDAILFRRVEDEAIGEVIRRRHGAALDAAVALRTVQADVWTVLHDARADGRLLA